MHIRYAARLSLRGLAVGFGIKSGLTKNAPKGESAFSGGAPDDVLREGPFLRD